MLKKFLKRTTLMTSLLFAPVVKADASLVGLDEIEEALRFLEEDALATSVENAYTVLPETTLPNSEETTVTTEAAYTEETEYVGVDAGVPAEERKMPEINADEEFFEGLPDDIAEAMREVNQQGTARPETLEELPTEERTEVVEEKDPVEEQPSEVMEEIQEDTTEAVEELPETTEENAVSEPEEVQPVVAPVPVAEKVETPKENETEELDVPAWPAALLTVAMLGAALFAATKIDERLKQNEKKLMEKLKKDRLKEQAETEAQEEKKLAEKLPESNKAQSVVQPQPTPVVSDQKKEQVQPAATPVVINITVNEVDEKTNRQKALRLLAQNKARRAVLTKQKRALALELNQPETTEDRKVEIKKALDEIDFERKELSQARREACRLYKGKKGEALQEQRRLYAKKMRQLHRLMKKDGLPHLKEINEINAVREAIKQEEKRMMAKAKDEMNMRAEKANWLHGIRSLKEVQAKQKNFESKIAQLKKENGLKKKEVLASDYALWHEEKLLKQEKREALHLVKGHTFTSQKTALTKQLKQALAENNKELIQKISEEYVDVKSKEKQFIEDAKTFDYDSQRIHMINEKTKDRILDRREQEEKNRCLDRQKRKRLARANFLRGQRMLYQLSQGLVPSVNENRITPQAYKEEALKLIGSKKIHYLYQLSGKTY